jgi:flagellin
MAISLLNNITALEAENQVNQTDSSLQNVLVQLSSGSRLNSGADDPAGLSIADSLEANITELNQAANNANTGIGLLQTADGSLSQVTNLLDRAITIATEAANGGLTSSQMQALDNEYTSIKAEIDRVGSQTTFNSTSVFTGTTSSIFLGSASNSIGVNISTLSSSALSLSGTQLWDGADTNTTDAASALSAINTAVSTVAQDRGTIGATLNRLTDAQNVINNQVTNLTSAENLIQSANIPQDVTEEAQYSVLEQTGISALSQANQSTQNILKLFQ